MRKKSEGREEKDNGTRQFEKRIISDIFISGTPRAEENQGYGGGGGREIQRR